jgi:hypothetical protein
MDNRSRRLRLSSLQPLRSSLVGDNPSQRDGKRSSMCATTYYVCLGSVHVLKVIDLMEELTDPVEHKKSKHLPTPQRPTLDLSEALMDLLRHNRVTPSLEGVLASLGYAKSEQAAATPSRPPPTSLPSNPPASAPSYSVNATTLLQGHNTCEVPLIDVHTELAMHFEVHTTQLRRKKLRRRLAPWSEKVQEEEFRCVLNRMLKEHCPHVDFVAEGSSGVAITDFREQKPTNLPSRITPYEPRGIY